MSRHLYDMMCSKCPFLNNCPECPYSTEEEESDE